MVFVGVTTVLGGVTELDSLLSTYSAWAIAHGQVACAYPPGSSVYFPLTAPLYTLVSSGLAVLFRVGHGVPFPSQAALGHTCLTWLAPMTHWSKESGALAPTLRFGYVGWIVLMFGIVALLRASGRGRCGWEPATLIAVACTPPVFMCLQYLFHPQDLMALGLVLGGVACAQRGSWAWAGVLLGLAFTTQQFALLALAPLLVVAPRNRRLWCLAAAVAAAAIVIVPLVALTSGRALRVALIGSGLAGAQFRSITWELHLTSTFAVELWRLMPIVFSMGLAWWAMKRLGPSVLEPVPLISLIATSLSLRLVFEEGLYGYYFVAVAAMIIVTDFVRRRFRIELIAWIAFVVLVFDPLPWGHDPWTYGVPMWIWQLALVPSAVALAVAPLTSFIRSHGRIEQVPAPHGP
jgi:hypothetical protein